MFWTRKDLKIKGKIAFKANYWKCVLVGFLASILTSSSSSSIRNASNSNDGNASNNIGDIISSGGTIKDALGNATDLGTLTNGEAIVLAGGLLVIVLIIIACAVAISVFLLNPLTVGCDNFFLKNRSNPDTAIDNIAFGFKANYSNVVLVSFMKGLFIFLWSLLLVVPGIIKSYEYRMVSYILSENPDMKYKEALKMSSELMKGQKWKAFVLDLSFIGWWFLGALTFGILNLFYVNPYVQATNAELYVALAHPESSNDVIRFGNAADVNQTVEFEK